MSFIAVTYGYNQYYIFNTNASTLSLIDSIISISMDEIISLIESRSASLKKEIELLNKESEELKNSDSKKQIILEKMNMKMNMITDYKIKFEKIDRKELKIDLIDGNGDRVNISNYLDSYANQYLIDRQCYELHKVFTSEYILI